MAVATNDVLDEDGLYERYLIPPRTAQRWRAIGEGPRWIRLGRRRVVYRVADIEAWLAERTFASRADELARSTSEAAPRDPPPPPRTRCAPSLASPRQGRHREHVAWLNAAPPMEPVAPSSRR
jgi:hypothetical protein